MNKGKGEALGRNMFTPATYITPKYKFPFCVNPDKQRKWCEVITAEIFFIFFQMWFVVIFEILKPNENVLKNEVTSLLYVHMNVFSGCDTP